VREKLAGHAQDLETNRLVFGEHSISQHNPAVIAMIQEEVYDSGLEAYLLVIAPLPLSYSFSDLVAKRAMKDLCQPVHHKVCIVHYRPVAAL
jgi:hypothetical protein